VTWLYHPRIYTHPRTAGKIPCPPHPRSGCDEPHPDHIQASPEESTHTKSQRQEDKQSRRPLEHLRSMKRYISDRTTKPQKTVAENGDCSGVSGFADRSRYVKRQKASRFCLVNCVRTLGLIILRRNFSLESLERNRALQRRRRRRRTPFDCQERNTPVPNSNNDSRAKPKSYELKIQTPRGCKYIQTSKLSFGYHLSFNPLTCALIRDPYE
jgi:hypothetical protein